MSVTSVSAAAWALVVDACRGDVDLARRYVSSDQPLRVGGLVGEIKITGPDIKDNVPRELWDRLMGFYDGDELKAVTFLLRPLPHFAYRPLGVLANDGSDGLELVMNYIGQIEAGVYI
jgi:hypothetical protein